MNLEHLEIAHTRISDISPLEGLTKLQSLDLTYNKVSDKRIE